MLWVRRWSAWDLEKRWIIKVALERCGLTSILRTFLFNMLFILNVCLNCFLTVCWFIAGGRVIVFWPFRPVAFGGWCCLVFKKEMFVGYIGMLATGYYKMLEGVMCTAPVILIYLDTVMSLLRCSWAFSPLNLPTCVHSLELPNRFWKWMVPRRSFHVGAMDWFSGSNCCGFVSGYGYWWFRTR